MSPVQWLAVLSALALLVAVIELVRRHALTEEYSLIWIVCAVAVLVLSLQRRWIDAAAARLGIYYPPALLLLGLGAFVLLIALAFSVALSRHRRQIDRLAEELALLEARVRDVRQDASVAAVPPPEVVDRPASERQGPAA